MDLLSPEALAALMGVMVINIVLSGDNAVVIGMAAHKLHGRQRMLAIIFGGGLAVVLRILLTLVAAYLLKIPALQFVGGLLLLWIAYKLLMEEVGEDQHKEADTFFQALWIITVADLIMSVDNILAIAAMAGNNMVILAIGLAISMAIVLFAGSIVAILMERFSWIVYIGSFAIAYIAGEMIMKDPFVTGLIPSLMNALVEMQMPIEIAIFPLVLGIVVPVLATWRNRQGKAGAEAETGEESSPPVAVAGAPRH
jgi:YjbE family integral membrane protein